MRSLGFVVLAMIEIACGAAAEVPGEGVAGRFDPRTAFMAQPLVGRAPRGFATCSRGASLAPFVVRDGRANAASKSDLRMQAGNKVRLYTSCMDITFGPGLWWTTTKLMRRLSFAAFMVHVKAAKRL
jgi:hypothetical protein